MGVADLDADLRKSNFKVTPKLIGQIAKNAYDEANPKKFRGGDFITVRADEQSRKTSKYRDRATGQCTIPDKEAFEYAAEMAEWQLGYWCKDWNKDTVEMIDVDGMFEMRSLGGLE